MLWTEDKEELDSSVPSPTKWVADTAFGVCWFTWSWALSAGVTLC